MHATFRNALVLAALIFAPLSAASAQGMLIPTDERVQAMHLNSHEVDFTIQDHAALTHVTQVFHNHTGRDLEATFYFAVPEGATTTDFALWMNGERISGEVLPRDEARSTYEAIVRRMRDPGLLEYVDGDLFQARIFPVPANGDQTVEIEYASVLEERSGAIRYTYPVHSGSQRSIPLFSASGEVSSSRQIANVYSPHHLVDIADQTAHSARIGMEQTGETPEDFEVFVSVTGDDIGYTLLTHDPDGSGGEDGYFMLTLAPSAELSELEVLPKHVTFVVDTSGSMSGQKMEQARATLRYCVEKLDERDSFNVIAFSTSVRTLFEEPMPVSSRTREQAYAWFDDLSARGNTNISGALSRALDEPVATDRPNAVIFITDGLPTEGDTNIFNIISAVESTIGDGDRRLFAFGVGYDVNTRLLDGMSRRGRGQSGYVRPNERINDVIGGFFDRVAAPVLTQIAIDFGDVEVDRIYPRPIPDLYRNGQLTVFGRYKNSASTVLRLNGRAGSRDWSTPFETAFGDAEPHNDDRAFVANLWAHRRVAALLTEIEDSGENPRIVSEIVELSTTWNIVTPYTSYLALDPSERMQLADRRNSRSGNVDEFDDFAPMQQPNVPMRGEGFGFEGGSGALDGSGSGRATGSLGGRERRFDVAEAEAAPAPTPDATTRAPRPSVGRNAVEESIATGALANRTQLDSNRQARVSQLGSRRFELSGNVWRQSGVGGVDERVEYLSDEYFALLRRHPELTDVFALGDRIVFSVGGTVYEITP